jgi:hypothetical protein
MSAIAVTFFQDFAARTKSEASLTLEALAERIRTTTAATKDELPWLKLALFGPLPNPATVSGSLRWNGNVQRISGVVVDYDGEEITPEEAAERLDKAGIAGLIYTSPSHLLNGHGPRWRACCPFDKSLPPDRHYQMVARLNGLFGGALAPESFVLSQSYFFGSVNGNPAHQAIVVDGMTTLDQCDELDEIAFGKPNGDGKTHPGGQPEAPVEDIRAALAVIPNPVPSWGPNASWIEWNNFGMAVWRASGGSHEGFEAFDQWSRQSPKYDADETEFRWRHYFDRPPTRLGFGSLVFLARGTQPGWVPPSQPPPHPQLPPDYSDDAMALKFTDLHQDVLRYVALWGKWMIWCGTHWMPEDTLKALDFARRVCRSASALILKPQLAAAIASAKTVNGVASLARSDRRTAETVDVWDRDPWALNTPTSTIGTKV